MEEEIEKTLEKHEAWLERIERNIKILLEEIQENRDRIARRMK